MTDTANRRTFRPYIDLFYARSVELGKHPQTGLMADGLDVTTLQPVMWTYPDGRQAPMSNFASQQNLMRGYIGYSMLTGDNQYFTHASELSESILTRYHDKPSGLLHWGGHRFVDWASGAIEGPASKECVHELKNHFPFYDLMYQTEPAVTERYLSGFWASHVMDWDKCDLTRHGEYGREQPESIFSRHTPKDAVDASAWPTLPETVGLTFVNASTDLIYAACHAYRYTHDQAALTWAKHLYRQFVLARHPKTRMPVYQFSSPLQREPVPEDDRLTYSWFGDRARRQFGPEFGPIALEANALFRDCWALVVDNPLALLACPEVCEDKEWLGWIIDGIEGYFTHAWDEATNKMKPCWADGTDLTGYQFVRDGYYGDKGTTLARRDADPAYLLTLTRAYRASQNERVERLLKRMLTRFELARFESSTGALMEVASETSLCSSYLLLALIEMHHIDGDHRWLTLADSAATQLITQHWHSESGLFVANKAVKYARFDDPIPYALLCLEAAHQGIYDELPTLVSSGGYLHGDRQIGDQVCVVYDRDVIYGERHNEMAMTAQ
ncbi:pectate lyase [Vibrio cholerae]